MSITTKRGDGGRTNLPGGIRVSKTDARVECYGTIDELISQMGFARSICDEADVRDAVKQVQRELFKIGSAIGTLPGSPRPAPPISSEMVQALDDQILAIEATPGVLDDWSIPGELPSSAALDVARSVCRRAERLAVGINEASPLAPEILAYLNRLSDLLWVMGRLVEARAGKHSKLRTGDQPGNRWSRAW